MMITYSFIKKVEYSDCSKTGVSPKIGYTTPLMRIYLNIPPLVWSLIFNKRSFFVNN